ncbi:MAG: hypothetical protein Q7R97_03460, partial [Candidatus Daviesbacteria bacterium]|nr:hypothetical protein [Candidatus Daviesbacteria bacterium]
MLVKTLPSVNTSLLCYTKSKKIHINEVSDDTKFCHCEEGRFFDPTKQSYLFKRLPRSPAIA